MGGYACLCMCAFEADFGCLLLLLFILLLETEPLTQPRAH